MKTIYLSPEKVGRKWYLVDAEGKTLGRVAEKVATILRGKHKPEFSPHLEMGDFVVVINAEKVVVTGNKRQQKLYYRHSGYPGGMTKKTYEQMIAQKPTFPLEHAVKGMLPKNSLGRKLFKNVKVYAGPEHPHEAQQPDPLEL